MRPLIDSPARITLILPYYRNPSMLLEQARNFERYPEEFRVVVVDDGSPYPEEAHTVLPPNTRAEVYRIKKDIPWNRNGARNLGAKVAETPWILHTDIDHTLAPSEAAKLVAMSLDTSRWYKFARFRVGAADETRQKDDLPPDADYGRVKPHVDSFLVTRNAYWRAGGYDEDFSGSLGGSSLFLKHLGTEVGEALLEDVSLCVHTRYSVKDASDIHLSRDRSRYERIRAEKRAAGDPKPASVCRFEWERVR